LFRESPLFTDAEKAVFEFSLAASSVPNQVDDAISSKLKLFWADGEIVEMLAVIALFGFLNRWNDSMGTSLEQAAVDSAEVLIGTQGWHLGKHR